MNNSTEDNKNEKDLEITFEDFPTEDIQGTLDNQEEFYDKLKEKLNDVEHFPSNYTYKFIFESNNQKLASIQKVFDGVDPQFSSKDSKNGKYTALTVVAYVLDASQVVHYYKEVGKLGGIMML